ncbi:MAG: hemolysin III [Bacteroidia bacterium]
MWALEPVLLLVFRVLTNSKNKQISSNLSFVIPFNQIHDRAYFFLKKMSNPTYSIKEEKLNVLTHAIGLALSIIALPFLIIRANQIGSWLEIVSFGVFGVSMIVLYAASTFYHNSTNEARRKKLNIFDHASIYVLIAGTYTPLVLVTLHGTVGWVLFGVTWGFALVGVILKLFFTGKYDLVSTIMYVLMGWIIVFAIKPLIANLATLGLYWLFAGGISYTIGAILYKWKGLKYNHAIFHVFVLLGTFCHFISVYIYVVW